jgi:phage shock protein A
MEVTQKDLRDLRDSIEGMIGGINQKLDAILDPKEGVFMEIAQAQASAAKALEEIKELYARQSRIEAQTAVMEKQVSDLRRFNKILTWIIGLIATPIFLGIGALIWNKLSG